MEMTTTVYNLEFDTPQIERIQKATLSMDDYGIQQTHGLFGSREWWEQITSGALPTVKLTGRISKVYMGSMGDWPMFEFRDAAGETHSFTRWAQNPKLDRLYAVGREVEVDYVIQKHKKSFVGGSLDTKVVTAVRIKEDEQASRRINRRAEVLHELVSFRTPTEPLLQELGSFGWDWDGDPLLILKKEHLVRVIDRFLAGEISAAQLQQWAENLEVREDVAFDEDERALVDPVFFRIATPEINDPLTLEVVSEMRRELTGENS